MAEHKVSAGTMLLFIDPNGGTAYDTVLCLRSVSITDSVAAIDISSWCGPGKLPGLNDITLSFDGYHLQDPNSGSISGTDLRILLRNKTTIGWKLSPASPVGGDEIQTGIGFISDLSSSYSFDNVGSFNFTINVKGDVTTTIQNNFTATLVLERRNMDIPNFYYFALISTSPFTMYLYTEFGDFEIESVPNTPYGYECNFQGNSSLNILTFNIIVNNPNDIVGIYNYSATNTQYSCISASISNFVNLIFIAMNENSLSENNVNSILYQLINNGLYNGFAEISDQIPSITLNAGYISTLQSRNWVLL